MKYRFTKIAFIMLCHSNPNIRTRLKYKTRGCYFHIKRSQLKPWTVLHAKVLSKLFLLQGYLWASILDAIY